MFTPNFLTKLKIQPHTTWIQVSLLTNVKDLIICVSTITSGMVKINPQFSVRCYHSLPTLSPYSPPSHFSCPHLQSLLILRSHSLGQSRCKSPPYCIRLQIDHQSQRLCSVLVWCPVMLTRRQLCFTDHSDSPGHPRLQGGQTPISWWGQYLGLLFNIS